MVVMSQLVCEIGKLGLVRVAQVVDLVLVGLV